MPKPKKRRGRPPLPMPEQIPDTPDNVARILMHSPPKSNDEWEYLEGREDVAKSKEDEDTDAQI